MRPSPVTRLVTACTVIVLVIGYLDYITGWEISFGVFYLLPIVMAAAGAGFRGGYAIAVLATVVWVAADRYAGHPYSRQTIFVWHVVTRFFAFMIVAYLAGCAYRRVEQKPPKPSAKPPAPRVAVPGVEELLPYQNRLSLMNKVGRLAWAIVWLLLFRPSPWPLHAWRALLLRCFGARIGRRCSIDPSLHVWAPWNLEVGDRCQLSCQVDCYTVDKIVIGNRVIISQGVYLCTASHDITIPGLPLTHAPITIGSNVWIATRAFLRPGVTVGDGGVVGACAVLTRDVDPWTVVSGSPARVVKRRAVVAAGSASRPSDVQPPVPACSPSSAAQTTMRRVGIVTFHMVNNYGAALQTYALQETLRRSGCDVTVVNYLPRYMMSGGEWLLPFSQQHIYADAGILLIKMKQLQAALFGRSQRQQFEDFRLRQLRITSRAYKSLACLREQPPDCHVLVCGSDQIWNPTPRFGVDPAYYLAFGARACRRVAFAPSFGGAAVRPDYHEQIGRLLAGLDAISVREDSGTRIVKELAGRHAAWMPDPTVLLENYDDLLVKPGQAGYVFTYCLCTSRAVGRIEALAARLFGLSSIAPMGAGAHWIGSGNTVQMGPREWLGYMQDARVVVTNSFHGTVFSILFRKPFVTVAIQGRKSHLNERLTSFLNRVGLSNRYVGPDSTDDAIVRLLQEPIDWSAAHARLQTWREEAWAYLRDAVAVPDAAAPRAGAPDIPEGGR